MEHEPTLSYAKNQAPNYVVNQIGGTANEEKQNAVVGSNNDGTWVQKTVICWDGSGNAPLIPEIGEIFLPNSA